jgi:hypothetical protein
MMLLVGSPAATEPARSLRSAARLVTQLVLIQRKGNF